MGIIDGQFYIDDTDDYFYLRQTGAWNFKGKLVRAEIVGFVSPPLFPYTAAQNFVLAPADRAISYTDAFSAMYSRISAENAPSGPATVVITDDLAAYLAYGDRAICTGVFAAGSKVATLSFNTLIVPAWKSMWIVMPVIADPNLAGVKAALGGLG